MERYRNLKGNAGVLAYEIFETAIDLMFQDGSVYRYSYKKPGRQHVEAMKRLAPTGKGLTTYVNVHVRDNYEAKPR